MRLPENMILFHRSYNRIAVIFSSFDRNREKNNKFDLFHLSKIENISILLVRDVRNLWYEDLYRNYNHILNIIEKYNEVLFFGFSMGGYAAFLIGNLLSINKVILLNPQVSINKKDLLAMGDNRFYNELENVPNDYRFPISEKININSKMAVDLYYSTGDIEDYEHACFLKKVYRNVNLIKINNASHSILSVLNYFGFTKKIIISGFSKEIFSIEDLGGEILKRNNTLSISSITFIKIRNEIYVDLLIKNTSNYEWNKDISENTMISILLKKVSGGQVILDYTDKTKIGLLPAGEQKNFNILIKIPTLELGEYEIFLNLKEGMKLSYEDIGYDPIRFNFFITSDINFGGIFYKNSYRYKFDNNFVYEKKLIPINFDSNAEYDFLSGSLKTDIGCIIDGICVFSEKEKGYAFFGPYITLNPGCYFFIANFYKIPRYGEAIMDIISGDNFIFRKNINFCEMMSNKVIIPITISETLHNLEFRLYIIDSSGGSVGSIEIISDFI